MIPIVLPLTSYILLLTEVNFMKKNEELRLDRFLSNQLNISRNDAKELIKKRLVSVNGAAAKLYDMKIDPFSDNVISEGVPVKYRKYIYIMLNKPQGVVCAVKDNLSPAVTGLIPSELRRKGLAPAGRLDKDTEGFVFITDDGAVAHRIISPSSHIKKKYYAELEQVADDSYIRQFRDGLVISGDEKCLPAEIEILPDRRRVYITVSEGKFHQVKRMAQAVGNKVIYLKRLSIGGLELDPDLPLGGCRELDENDVSKLF